MHFTSRIKSASVVGRLLTVVLLGLVALAIVPAQITANENPSVQQVSAWYKNKHWWKKNAPIVGGAAGGALIGGLAGGGKGLLIGGAIGGGGGYAYKRLEERHHRHEAQKRYREQERYRSASAARHTTTHQPAQ